MREKGGDVLALLHRLGSEESDRAWESFIDFYGPVLLQVVQYLERDQEVARDCFIFVCEQLAANRFRRLRRYGAKEQATFETWLRCVARNLCVDWQRSNSGRRRPFRVIQDLTALEQEVFRLHFMGRVSARETTELIRQQFPDVSESGVSGIMEKIYSLLSPRQLWLLASRSIRLDSIDDLESPGFREIENQGMTPEDQLLKRELWESLSQGLHELSPEERRLLKLRFEDGRSLKDCADSMGLENPQRVHRMVASILSRLRASMSA